jgi:hypothetical protein
MIEVQFGSTCLPCTIKGTGICRNCGEAILWAVTPAEKFVPLNPEELERGLYEPHFGTCAGHKRSRGREEYPRPAPPPTPVIGIEMTVTTWKQLLRLIHPDKHFGGEDEKLANTLTGWLLEQRPRLKPERRNP